MKGAKSNTENTAKLKNGKEERYTAVYDSAVLDAAKNIAHWDRKKIKDILDEGLSAYVETWKADPKNKAFIKAGKIMPRPENKD